MIFSGTKISLSTHQSPHKKTVSKYMHVQQEDQQQMNQIKNRQMINNFLDTIDQKNRDPNELRRSLNHFDKQVQDFYCQKNSSTISQTLKKQLYFDKRPSSYRDINRSQTLYRSQSYTNTNKNIKKRQFCLKIPKPNTLTDQFMKLTLGSEQQLIQQYQRTVNPNKFKEIARKQKLQNAKKMFQPNTTAPPTFILQNKGYIQEKSKAFYDDTYYTYLKTNMKYLQFLNEKNQTHKNIQKKSILQNNFKNHIKNQYELEISQVQAQSPINLVNRPFSEATQPYTLQSNFRTLNIAQKIKQTGGIENTIQNMEKSLKKNELKHINKNKYLQRMNSFVIQNVDKQRKNNHIGQNNIISPSSKKEGYIKSDPFTIKNAKETSQIRDQKKQNRSSWVDRSKSLRQRYSQNNKQQNS